MVLHGSKDEALASTVAEVGFARYRERLHLSYSQFLDEPLEEVKRMLLIWSLDDEHDKLEVERRKMQDHQ